MSTSATVEELKNSLLEASPEGKETRSGGLVLDIDETLAATNVAWFERLIRLFGTAKPDHHLSLPQLIDKYHFAQNNPHWEKSTEAQKWMQEQRDAPEAQDGLPLIPQAVECVQQLMSLYPNLFVGYVTVRPEKVSANTIQWLQENGFPNLPVVSKPNEIAFSQGTQWKAQALHTLYPQVIGIVDDNPKLPMFVGPNYKGTVYLFGRDKVEKDNEWTIPCKTWPIVVEAIVVRQEAEDDDDNGKTKTTGEEEPNTPSGREPENNNSQ